MKEWFSISELVALKSVKLPLSHRGILIKAKRESWISRPRKGLGGGKEYKITSFPIEVQRYLKTKVLTEDISLSPVSKHIKLKGNEIIDNNRQIKTIILAILKEIPQIKSIQLYRILCDVFGAKKAPKAEIINIWLENYKLQALRLFLEIAR